jgi:hypothetical protein
MVLCRPGGGIKVEIDAIARKALPFPFLVH